MLQTSAFPTQELGDVLETVQGHMSAYLPDGSFDDPDFLPMPVKPEIPSTSYLPGTPTMEYPPTFAPPPAMDPATMPSLNGDFAVGFKPRNVKTAEDNAVEGTSRWSLGFAQEDHMDAPAFGSKHVLSALASLITDDAPVAMDRFLIEVLDACDAFQSYDLIALAPSRKLWEFAINTLTKRMIDFTHVAEVAQTSAP